MFFTEETALTPSVRLFHDWLRSTGSVGTHFICPRTLSRLGNCQTSRRLKVPDDSHLLLGELTGRRRVVQQPETQRPVHESAHGGTRGRTGDRREDGPGTDAGGHGRGKRDKT